MFTSKWFDIPTRSFTSNVTVYHFASPPWLFGLIVGWFVRSLIAWVHWKWCGTHRGWSCARRYGTLKKAYWPTQNDRGHHTHPQLRFWSPPESLFEWGIETRHCGGRAVGVKDGQGALDSRGVVWQDFPMLFKWPAWGACLGTTRPYWLWLLVFVLFLIAVRFVLVGCCWLLCLVVDYWWLLIGYYGSAPCSILQVVSSGIIWYQNMVIVAYTDIVVD